MRAIVIEADWDPRPDADLTPMEREGRWARDARTAWRHPRWASAVRPDPVLVTPDDVIVRIRAVGIAVSNLRMIETDPHGYVQLPYRMRLPLVPGHEVAGEVVEVGSAVGHLQPGDPVALETLRPCGWCLACRGGLPNHCTDGEFSGFSVDGGMAEYVCAPARHVRPLNELRDRFEPQAIFEIGALCEPASVAFVGMFLRAGGFPPGATVSVFGCGPIGLAAAALARCAGAAAVLAFDRVPQRCAAARKIGADVSFDVGELERAGTTPSAQVLDHTKGRGADIAIDATGSASEVLPQIEAALGIGGKVVHLGVGGPPAVTRTMAYLTKAASAHYAMGHLGGFEPVIGLHAAGRLDLRSIVSRRYALAEGLDAFQHAALRQDTKTLVLPAADPCPGNDRGGAVVPECH